MADLRTLRLSSSLSATTHLSHSHQRWKINFFFLADVYTTRFCDNECSSMLVLLKHLHVQYIDYKRAASFLLRKRHSRSQQIHRSNSLTLPHKYRACGDVIFCGRCQLQQSMFLRFLSAIRGFSECVCVWLERDNFYREHTTMFVSAEYANATAETNGTRLSRGATCMVFCRLRRRGFSSAGGGRRVLRASGFCGMVADTTFVLFITLPSVFRRHGFFLIRMVESDRVVVIVGLLCAFR